MDKILNSQLVSDFKQGDQKAFKWVFDRYYPALLLFINKLIGNREEAEDIAVRAFQALFDRCNLFESEMTMKAFLYVTARNASLNYLRTKQNERAKLQRFSSYYEHDGYLEFEFNRRHGILAAIHNAVEELPAECGRVFKMLFYDELEPAEIAVKLNIALSTVYNQKSRALLALRIRFLGGDNGSL